MWSGFVVDVRGIAIDSVSVRIRHGGVGRVRLTICPPSTEIRVSTPRFVALRDLRLCTVSRLM